MLENYHSQTLEIILLGLLEEEPLHGYALFQKLQATDELSRIWHVKRSKVYYLLEKLVNQGLLEPEIERCEGSPDRKIFHLTGKGKQLLQEWVQTPVSSGREMRVTFLSRLFFALRKPGTSARQLIRDQKKVCRSWKTSLESQLAELDPPDFITERVFAFRIGQVQAMLDWLEECQQAIPAEED